MSAQTLQSKRPWSAVLMAFGLMTLMFIVGVALQSTVFSPHR